MIYKRATAKLQAAGITDIQIHKCLYGAVPRTIGVKAQTATVYKTPDEAVAAVLAGYRPTVTAAKDGRP